jgi:hypothetical protein
MISPFFSASINNPLSAKSFNIPCVSTSLIFHIPAAFFTLKGFIGNIETRPASFSEKRIFNISKRSSEAFSQILIVIVFDGIVVGHISSGLLKYLIKCNFFL